MIKRYPTLYSRDSASKVRVWWQEQDGGKYRTHAGVQDGSIVVSEWTIVEQKNVGRANETSLVEQAQAEVEAKYVKQLKTGYSESVKDIDTNEFQEPMLAKKLKDRLKKLTFPAMLDRKYNGGRVNVKPAGTFTRKGELWKTIPHIYAEIKPLFSQFPSLFVDGEGYNHEYRYHLNDLMSIMRKQKDKEITPELLKKSAEIIKLYCYDGYGFTVDGKEITKETGCKERREALKKLFKGFKNVVVVEYFVVKSLEELYEKYQEFVDDGYEGAMYRELNGEYEHKRSSNLLKCKPEDDAECEVISVREGTGNWSGVAKTATVKWEGLTFDATFKGSYDELKALNYLNHPEKIVGKKPTFLYNGLTGKGVPNYARIDVNNCFSNDK